MEHLIATRGEVLSTMLIDGILVVGAVWIRAGVLRGMEMVQNSAADNWVVTALELTVDIGTIATAIAITGFDLVKRIRLAHRDYQR